LPNRFSSDSARSEDNDRYATKRIPLLEKSPAISSCSAPWLYPALCENHGQFSPDGRWVAYQSDESGRKEIYVRPFSPDDFDALWEK